MDEDDARYDSLLFASGRLDTERQEVPINERPREHLDVKAFTIARREEEHTVHVSQQ